MIKPENKKRGNDVIKDSYFHMSPARGNSLQGTFFDISYIIKNCSKNAAARINCSSFFFHWYSASRNAILCRSPGLWVIILISLPSQQICCLSSGRRKPLIKTLQLQWRDRAGLIPASLLASPHGKNIKRKYEILSSSIRLPVEIVNEW